MFISCPFEGAEEPVASAQNGNETNLAATSFEETTAAKSKYLYTNIHLLKFIFFVLFTEAIAEKPLTRTQKDNETKKMMGKNSMTHSTTSSIMITIFLAIFMVIKHKSIIPLTLPVSNDS